MSLVKKIVCSRGVCRKNVDKNVIDTVVHNVRCVCHTVGIVDKDSCSSQS